MKEVEKSIKWAEKEVLRAREIAQAKSKITFDADQYDEQFEIGEAVRLYKDIPARRDPRTGEMHASKLQLKTLPIMQEFAGTDIANDGENDG